MKYKLKKAEEEILRLAVAAVKYARNLCADIEFSPGMPRAPRRSSYTGWWRR